jgi:branched-chain amino acid transport system substrate-binding protein
MKVSIRYSLLTIRSSIRHSLFTIRTWLCLALAIFLLITTPARAADPIKVGFSMALTGAVAPNGKQLLLALEIWRDDVNAKGGLMGRPVELVYYDDQSNPANVPGIYTKLISIDKVDLLIGPYATNMAAPAMPVIMAAGKTTISILAIGINRHFNYPRYFSMVPVGPQGVKAFSRGFFELAAEQSPKPQTVALIAADAEFARTASDGGARERAGARLQDRLRQELSPAHHGFLAGDARRPGDQSGRGVRGCLPARHRRHRARGK